MTWLVQSFTTGLLKGLLNPPTSDSEDKLKETESKTDDAALKVIQHIHTQGQNEIKPDIFSNFTSPKTSDGMPELGNRVVVGSRQETGELMTLAMSRAGNVSFDVDFEFNVNINITESGNGNANTQGSDNSNASTQGNDNGTTNTTDTSGTNG